MPEPNHRVSTRAVGALLALAGLALPVTGLWTPALTAAQTRLRTDLPQATAQLPTLSVEDAAVTEGDAGVRYLVFKLHLSQPAENPVIVDVSTADSTATLADGDYAAVSQQLTFAPGSVAESLSVAVGSDTKVELDEHLLVRFVQSAGAAVSDSEAVGTILNDDLPKLTIGDASVTEGDAGSRALRFTVRLSEPVTHTVGVDIATADSTATLADGDYSAEGLRLTFLPGSVAESLTVGATGDTRIETDELLLVRLSNPAEAALADSEAVGTILNDDPITVSIDDAVTTEGNAGTKALVFVVHLSRASAGTVVVNAETFDSTATAGGLDYQPLSVPVTFAPGSLAGSVSVVVTGDAVAEANESLIVRLSAPVGAVLADSEAVGTLLNDDIPSISIDDASVLEGDSGTRTFWFKVHLSAPYVAPVSVVATTIDGTASLADQDYVLASLGVSFPPGTTSDSVAVAVRGDTAYEADEWLRVRLSSPAGAVLADTEAVGTILNDDLPVISVGDTAVREGHSGTRTMTFRVRLTPSVSTPVSFHYRLLDGSAMAANQDFEAASGEVIIPPGENQVLVEIPVLGDSLLEGNERFSLHLYDIAGATPGEQWAVGTILNDERTSFVKFIPPVPRFSSGTLPPAWGDLDSDGQSDLPLYLNNGSQFEEMPGVRGLLGNGNYHGAAWCDYDRDGDQDLVIMPYSNTVSSYNFTHLFQNTPNGLMEVAPAAGMDIIGFGETASWADFNADGWPDLFLPFYSHVAPFRSYFYLNQGNGQFREFADSAGISLPNIPIQLRPEGVGVADWNGDGALDLYCASHLFINDGDAHFTDVRAQVGLPINFDEGAQFVDFDDDGDLDLYLRTSRGPTLYRNSGGAFTDVTSVLGIGFVDWAWGDRWADLDGDGDLDLIYFPPGQIVRLQLNNGDGTFSQDSSFTGVLNGSFLSAFADMDMDGDIDIATGDWDRQIARNLLERVPNAQSGFLKVRVEDEGGRLTAFGATVRLRSLDDPKHPVQTRIVDGGSGYLGQDEYVITFGGVGSGRFDLEVSYPGKPENPRVVGPTQNPLLAGIQPGLLGPQLVVIRPNGEAHLQSLASATAAVLPSARFASTLRPAAPNPARGMTRLSFHLPADGDVRLTVHDLAGREVRSLLQGSRRAGEHTAVWDLRDNGGRRVPTGLYFVRLERSRHEQLIQRVVVLH